MKKALLIGIEYKNSNHRLNGCIDDVVAMRKMLIENFGFQEQHIVTLTESQATKTAIESGIRNLMISSNSTDSIFFMFCGHGNQVRTSDKLEVDKLNEGILSYDNRLIVDDTLKGFADLTTAQLICMFDCCHSGTIMDNSKAIILSACADSETSADVKVNGNPSGMFSFSVQKALKTSAYLLTYEDLIKTCNVVMKDHKIKQTPQLVCEAAKSKQLFLGGGGPANIVYPVGNIKASAPFSWFSNLFKK